MVGPRPEGVALSIVGSAVLLGSTVITWFSVPTEDDLVQYKIFGRPYASLHDYTMFGRAFEVLTVLAGVFALLAIVYASVFVGRMKVAGNLLTACGLTALAVVLTSWITFVIANPVGVGRSGEVRLGPGAILAALSGAGILAGGVLTIRGVPSN